MAPISTKSTYFNVTIYSTLHTKLAPAVPEIRVPETRRISLYFSNSSSSSSSLHQTIKVYGNYVLVHQFQ